MTLWTSAGRFWHIKGAAMEYSIYKLNFQSGVHFGTGTLNESTYTFQADQLFSALYIEALKLHLEQEFYNMVKSGRLLFSDSFPYCGKQYMLPKPMLYVEPSDRGKSDQKKAYKKLKYLPMEQLSEFLSGTMDLKKNPAMEFGRCYQQTMASVRNEKETTPFRVGTFYFYEGNGLYVIIAHQGSEEAELMDELMDALSYTGIGGKKASGLGKFELLRGKVPEKFVKQMEAQTGRYMLLSTALPMDLELEEALEGATYQLKKQSGFVASDSYADEWRRKKDLYVISAGACFKNRFQGDIYDVSNGGMHPVYRYAKPLFMGV